MREMLEYLAEMQRQFEACSGVQSVRVSTLQSGKTQVRVVGGRQAEVDAVLRRFGGIEFEHLGASAHDYPLETVDWSKITQYSENDVECACGCNYSSHTKAHNFNGDLALIAKRKCPNCGFADRLVSSRSVPEIFKL